MTGKGRTWITCGDADEYDASHLPTYTLQLTKHWLKGHPLAQFVERSSHVQRLCRHCTTRGSSTNWGALCYVAGTGNQFVCLFLSLIFISDPNICIFRDPNRALIITRALKKNICGYVFTSIFASSIRDMLKVEKEWSLQLIWSLNPCSSLSSGISLIVLLYFSESLGREKERGRKRKLCSNRRWQENIPVCYEPSFLFYFGKVSLLCCV